jgi:GT2 family glycosyltransferase
MSDLKPPKKRTPRNKSTVMNISENSSNAPTSSARDHDVFTKVKALLETGPTEAITAVILEHNAASATALIDLAEFFFTNAYESLATQAYLRLAELQPTEGGHFGRLGDLALRRNDPLTAAQVFRKALTLFTTPPDWAFIGLGNALELLGDFSGALACLTQVSANREIKARRTQLEDLINSRHVAVDIGMYIDACLTPVKGYVETIRGHIALGWIFDAENQRDVEVEVLYRGKVVASALATETSALRKDYASITRGKQFRIELPVNALTGDSQSLVFRDSLSLTEIPRFGYHPIQAEEFTVKLEFTPPHTLQLSFAEVTPCVHRPVNLDVWAGQHFVQNILCTDFGSTHVITLPESILENSEYLFTVFCGHTLVGNATFKITEADLSNYSSYNDLMEIIVDDPQLSNAPGPIRTLLQKITRSALFDVEFYAKSSKKKFHDARDAAIHYLTHPEFWLTPTSAWLDPHFLHALGGKEVGIQSIDKGDVTISPLEWYIKQSWTKDVGPNPLFSNSDYVARIAMGVGSSLGNAPTLFDHWLHAAQKNPISPSVLVNLAHISKKLAQPTYSGSDVLSALLHWLTQDRNPSFLHPIWVTEWLHQQHILHKAKTPRDWLSAYRLGLILGIAPHPVIQHSYNGNFYQLVRKYELLCWTTGVDHIENLCPLIIPDKFYAQFGPCEASLPSSTRKSGFYCYLEADLAQEQPQFLLDFDADFITAQYPGLLEFCHEKRAVGDPNFIWARWLRLLRISGCYESSLAETTKEDVLTAHELATLRSMRRSLCSSHIQASFIIPSYARDDLVMRVILSLAKSHTDTHTIEILIAEDSDQVDCAWILEYFLPFAIIHKNSKNLGFLLSCNAAVSRSSGAIIVLVNNDVLLHKDALRELLLTFQMRSDAAVVGGLILNVDGTIQENGGLIWNDASAWNYHRNLNPDEEHLRNVREVEYVTGAWIGIRRHVWDELGGFDPHFVPAYCEEADLCLSAAARGYKTYVNPHSVVTHLEGATMGSDTAADSLKAYQITNSRKLYNKWHSVLSVAHQPNAKISPFHTGRTHPNRFITVVFDHYLPEYDRDAGSRTIFAICEALTRIENNYVIFVPANNFRSRYAVALERMGIECITGSQGWSRFDHLLAEHSDTIRHVFVSRIDVARRYKWHLDQMRCQKSLYIHDIDTLRGFAYTPENPEFQKLTSVAIAAYINRHSDVFDQFNTIISCSKDETQLLLPFLREKIIEIFPYTFKPASEQRANKTAKDIIFVGSYNHRPNQEGVEWFLYEVWPQLRENLPDAKFHLVGSGFENTDFADHDNRIIVHGQVTDQTLRYLYSICRVSIAPLLSGAGIKGKLVEACAIGLPCVGTEAAWQGLTPPAGYGYLSGTDATLTSRIVKTYKAYGDNIYKALIDHYQSNLAHQNHIDTVIPELIRNSR